MDPSRYLASIEQDTAAVCAALAVRPDAPVPGCPGWDVAKVGLHLGMIYTWVEAQVRQRATEPVDMRSLPRGPDGPDRVPWLAERATAMVDALAAAGGDAPAGGWRKELVTASFWRRRMAHETLVHRADVDEALGAPVALDTEVDPILVADGIDEVLGIFLPYAKDGAEPVAPLHLVASEDGTRWTVETTDGGLRSHRSEDADPTAGAHDPTELAGVTVTAPAPSLLLLAWGRRQPAPDQVSGDLGALPAWLERLHW